MKKIKIALVVNFFPPKWLGGTEIASYNIATHLSKHGYDTNVVTYYDEGLPQKSIEFGFKIFRVSSVRIRLFEPIIFWLKIASKIRRIDPTFILIQSISLGIPGYLAKKLFRYPYIVWARGTDVNSPDWLTRICTKMILKNADSVIALTENMKRKMENNCSRNIHVIPNGIDFEKFQGLSKELIRKKFSFASNDLILIYVGRFRKEKGHIYLIESMRHIKQEINEVRLILCGDGPEEEEMRNLVKKFGLEGTVQFFGKVTNERIPEFLAAADIFILPSLTEGFPNVLLEAMASGLPIITTDVDGVSEIIQEGNNGYIIPPRSPEKIAEAVINLSHNTVLLKKLSDNNLQKIRQFSWNRIIQQLENCCIFNKYSNS